MPVAIDGYSQPVASVNILAEETNATLMIEINGSDYSVGDGMGSGIGLHLVVGSDNSTI